MEKEGMTFNAIRELVKRLAIKGQIHEYIRLDQFLKAIDKVEEKVEEKSS